MTKGESVTFSYTGNIQTWEVPNTGVYELEVWGGQGGGFYGRFYDSGYVTVTRSGGGGGYAKGKIKLQKGDTYYIGVGGAGQTGTWNHDGRQVGGGGGGYNGGSSSYNYDNAPSGGNMYIAGGSGGYSHIATTNGTINSVAQADRLIVAGGGGGAGHEWHPSGYDATWNGSAGSGQYFDPSVEEITRSNGVRSGNGQVKITLVKKASFYIGDTEADGIYVGDNEADAIYVGDTEA